MYAARLSFASIRPFVRFAKEIILPDERPEQPVCAYDHRLLYITGGQARITWDGAHRELSPGSAAFWPAGTPYLIQPQVQVQGICINFDFTQMNAASATSIPMSLLQDYDPSRCMESIAFDDAPMFSAPLFVPEFADALPLLQAMERGADQPERFTPLQLSCLMGAVLCHMQRQAAQPAKTGSAYRAILDYIHAHYEQELSNQLLGRMFGYHPNYISQLVQEHTGVPLHQYVLKLRISQAVHLLETTDIPIAEIAGRVGFKNVSYFSQYFKKQTGYPPRAFRLG